MLARVFEIDVLKCDCCGGKLRPICAVTESDSIRRYLVTLDIDYEPPLRGRLGMLRKASTSRMGVICSKRVETHQVARTRSG